VAFGQAIELDTTHFLASFGGGLEYYIADNLALGLQVKYLLGPDQEYRLDGARGDFSVDAPLTMLSIRVLGPQLRPQEFADLQAPPPTRLYFGPRLGAGIPADRSVGPGLRWTPESNSIGDWNQAFGLFFGASFGPHFAVELAAETMEGRLEVEGRGTIGEMASYTLMPIARWRFPLRGGRLAPYALAGVGLGFSEFNDRRPAGAGLDIGESKTGWAGTLGAGAEWFVLSNLAAFAEARYTFHRGTGISLDDEPERGMDLDSINLSLGVRIFFADFHRQREQPVR
jgi:opacity protein-like surface antigen